MVARLASGIVPTRTNTPSPTMPAMTTLMVIAARPKEIGFVGAVRAVAVSGDRAVR